MKMKMKLTVLACAALFGLTACGSSGNGSGVTNGSPLGGGAAQPAPNPKPTPTPTPKPTPTPTPKPTPTPTPTPKPTPTPTPTPKPTPSNAFEGVAIPAEGYTGAITPVSGVSSSTLDNVTVNGINITLKQPGITARKFTNIRKNTETTIASGTYLSHMRFGAYSDFNHNNNPDSNPSYTFALGSVTPVADVPTSGTATYNGLAVGSPIGGGAFQEGTSTFNVDFGAKRLNGSVTIGAFNPVPLTANINGNQFSGTSAEGVHTDGRFYGPQAAEMGGVFNGEVSVPGAGGTLKWIGSFGAKK